MIYFKISGLIYFTQFTFSVFIFTSNLTTSVIHMFVPTAFRP